ncbi:MAG: carbon-nitrogen hydrolase family protein [archaeon]
MKNPVIAVAQIRYFDKGKNNLKKIKKYIKLAKKVNADIICFPETCIHKTEFLHLRHRFIKEICQECKENKIWAIITEHLTIKKKDYNMAILINRNGKVKGSYKKIHLYGDEVDPGKQVKVFETDLGKIGIVICWDLRFPETFKKMREKGADIVFCSSKWQYDKWAHDKKHKKKEIKILESLIKTRAYENLFYVALCNPLTESKYQVSYSAIASPHDILKEIIGKEGLIACEVNLKDIRRLRRLYGDDSKI